MKKSLKIVLVLALIGGIFGIGSVVLKSSNDDKNTHKVTFDLNNGQQNVVVSVKDGNVVKKIDDPSKDGYIFDGWTLNGKDYDFNTPIVDDIVLIASWKKNPKEDLVSNVTEYTVSFDTSGGNSIPKQIVEEGKKVSQPADPVREGYIFVEWQLMGKKYDFSSVVKKNMTLVAVWKEDETVVVAPQHVVTFDSNGGSYIASQSVISGERISKPQNPQRSGYTFVQWKLNGSPFNFNLAVTGDITLVAEWKEIVIVPPEVKYSINFDSNGGSNVLGQAVKANGKAVQPANPTRAGYTFVEWELNGRKYDFNTKITQNITLVAKWEKNSSPVLVRQYTVTFETNGGSYVPKQLVNENERALRPMTPSRAGYTFVAWNLNGSEYNFGDRVTSNITLVASWKENAVIVPQYVVYFNSNGGSYVASQVVNQNEKAMVPISPAREGYTFVGWKLNGNTYDFNSPVNGNLVLVAEWRQNTPVIPNYTVTFNSNGGTSVPSQTIKSGEKVTKPSNPTRDGYTFVEWRLNGIAYNFNTAVTDNITLVAEWRVNTPVIPTYTVTFDSNGGTPVESQTIKSGEKAIRPTNPTKVGYTFVEWKLNGSTYDFNTPITGNVTLVAEWRQVPTYTVTFNSNGGSSVSTQTIQTGEKATKPNDPTKSGYTFVEWKLNGNTYDFNSPVTENITLVAEWRQIPVATYTVTFNSNGGSSVSSQTIQSGQKATKPADPTKLGYTFVGWKLNGNTYDFNTPVTSNITLVAGWNIIPSYTVTFNSNGGSSVSSQTVRIGEKVTKPNDPTRDGYIFVGWKLNGSTYDFNTSVTSNITLTAEWKQIPLINYTVTFDSNGGTSISSQTVQSGQKATKPTNPTKLGYTFVGWKLNGGTYDFNTPVTANITLIAEWNVIPSYTVTFDSNGGTSVSSQTIRFGEKATKPSNPTKLGYTFASWKLNGSVYDFNTVVTSDITLIAEWNVIPSYTVTFDSNGGSRVSSQTVRLGEKATKPTNPTKAGYTFVRWKLNGNAYDFNTTITGDITLVAEWEALPNYTVTFDSKGGSSVSSQTIQSGQKATKPTDPTKSGYTFAGWKLNGSTYNFNSAVTGNITLVAEWEAIPNYTVVFNSTGGSYVSSQTVQSGQKATKPSNPTKSGYTFMGWKLNGNTYDFNTAISGNITLVADWRFNLNEHSKSVGIYYSVWFNNSTLGDGSSYNRFRFITKNGVLNNEIGTWTYGYWGEPALGFYGYFRDGNQVNQTYLNRYKEVIRIHMEQLQAAGIDYIIIDQTNIRPTWVGCERGVNCGNPKAGIASGWNDFVVGPETVLFDVILEMRAEGLQTPYVVNWIYETNSIVDGNNITYYTDSPLVDLYEQFYENPKYANIWVYEDAKPFILGTQSNEFRGYYKTDGVTSMDNLISFRKMWGKKPDTYTSKEWSFLEDDYGYTNNFGEGREQLPVAAAVQRPFMSDHRTAYGRREGCTLYEQWKYAFEKQPKVIVVSEWNEWIAQRQEPVYKDVPPYKDLPFELQYFVDNYDFEYSRDIEPRRLSDGSVDDSYYQWTKKYISAYKSNGTLPNIGSVTNVSSYSACPTKPN